MTTNNVVIKEISRNLYILRTEDYETRFFEALWEIPEGITYNAYLLLTEEGAVLLDLWKKSFSKKLIETLKCIIDLKDIKYVIIHHAEPDHTGSLPELLKHNDKVTVIGQPLAKSILENFYRINLRFKPVKDREELRIREKTLKIIHTPWLHWPETIMTFLEEENILFSCDAFGGYSVPSSVFDENDEVIAKYIPYVRKYFATVIGHYRNFVIKNVEKISNLNIRIIAPAHGLVWVKKPQDIINYYVKLAKGEAEVGKVTVLYSSMYGNVESAISEVTKMLLSKGFKVKVYRFTGKHQDALSDIVSDIIDSEALIVGAATYEVGIFPQIKHVLEIIIHKLSMEKPVLIISSYGWGGIAGRKISKILTDGRFKVFDVIEFRGAT